MFKALAAVTIGAAMMTIGTSAGAAAPPNDVATVDAEMFGTGVSGSLPYSIPDCPSLTQVDVDASGDNFLCVPLASPVPQSTVQLVTDGSTCTVGAGVDLEGAFTQPTQMRTLVECVLPVAIAWMQFEYGNDALTAPTEWSSLSGSLLPNNFVYVPTGAVSPYGCGTTDDYMLAYCSWDGNIYLSEVVLWETYQRHGDGDVWGSISHEIGHRVQHVANFRARPRDNHNESIPAENQADCFSGAFLNYANRQGYIDAVTTGDDLNDLFDGLFAIGEQEGADQNHGTIDQRIRAFFVGYNSSAGWGVFACSSYVTDVSIVPRYWDATAPLGPDTPALIGAAAG